MTKDTHKISTRSTWEKNLKKDDAKGKLEKKTTRYVCHTEKKEGE
jgi:hypothetical protein